MYKVCSSIVCFLSRADRVESSKANMILLKLFVGGGEGLFLLLFSFFLTEVLLCSFNAMCVA